MNENNDFDRELEEFEDEQLSRKDRIKSKIKFVRVFLCLIMVLSAIILLFANKDKLNIDNLKRLASKIDFGNSTSENADMAQIDFDYDSSSIVDVYKDGIARVGVDSLSIIDNMGTQFQNVLTGFNTPSLITTSKYVLAYDKGGNKLIITNSFSVLFEKVFEDNIVDVSINSNGYFTVITESKAYKNKLTVYDSDFEEVLKINSKSWYFISADISDDNKHIAVSALYSKDSDIKPQIICYKLGSEEILWSCDFEENLAVSLKAKDDGSVCAIFEWGMCILDSKGKEKFRYEFADKIVQCFYIGKERYNTLVLSESVSGNSEIYVYDNNGKQVADIKTDYTALSVDMCSDRLAVASADNIYVYTASGRLIDERENLNDGSRILFSDRNSVLSVSSSNVIYNIID